MHWAQIVDGEDTPILPAKKATCHLPISVGRIYYEGEALKDILESVNVTFGFCIIHIADTLQAKTLKLKEPQTVAAEAQKLAASRTLDWKLQGEKDKDILLEEAARFLVYQKGLEWRQRNEKIILSVLKIPYKIDHWSDWTSLPSFPVYLASIEKRYNDPVDLRFKNAVDSAATNFVSVLNTEVKQGTIPPFDPEIAGRENKGYVKEETAIVKLWQDNWTNELPSQSDAEQSRFIVVYPVNTPAHRCMVSCLDALTVGTSGNAPPSKSKIKPEMEFFDIAFYCDKPDGNPVPSAKLYQLAKKEKRSQHRQQLSKKQQVLLPPPSMPNILTSQAMFFQECPASIFPAAADIYAKKTAEMTDEFVKSSITLLQWQIEVVAATSPPDVAAYYLRQIIGSAQRVQMQVKAKAVSARLCQGIESSHQMIVPEEQKTYKGVNASSI